MTTENLENKIEDITNALIGDIIKTQVKRSDCGCSRDHARQLFNLAYDRIQTNVNDEILQDQMILELYKKYQYNLHSYCLRTDSNYTESNTTIINNVIDAATRLLENGITTNVWDFRIPYIEIGKGYMGKYKKLAGL